MGSSRCPRRVQLAQINGICGGCARSKIDDLPAAWIDTACCDARTIADRHAGRGVGGAIRAVVDGQAAGSELAAARRQAIRRQVFG